MQRTRGVRSCAEPEVKPFRLVQPLRIATLAAVIIAWPAAARIAVLPLTGVKNPSLERQLGAAVCNRLGCVPSSTVLTGKKLDWSKVSRAKLQGVLVGRLSREHPQVLELTFFGANQKQAWRKRYRVAGGRISTATLVSIRDQVAAAAQKSIPTAPPVKAPPRPQPPTPAAPTPPGEIAPPPPGEIAPPSPALESAEAPASAAEEAPSLLEVEVGIQLLHRKWDYQGLQPGTGLRTYSLALETEPRVRIGLYPFRWPEGLVAQLGLELSGSLALGPVLGGADPSDPKSPLSLWSAEAALRLRLRLGDWTLGPALGFRLWHAAGQPNSTGATLSGLPAVDVHAGRIALAAEGPSASAFGFTGELSYLQIFSAGQLFEPPYFPSGKGAPSFEGRLGATWRASPNLQLFLAATGSVFNFDLNDASPPRATSARALAFGGEFGFRLGL
jgi:hypothetical protein